MDAAVKKLEAGGVTISKDIRSRLSPLIHEHINFYLDTSGGADPCSTALALVTNASQAA